MIDSCHAGSQPSKPQSLLGDVELGPLAVFSLPATAFLYFVSSTLQIFIAFNLKKYTAKSDYLDKDSNASVAIFNEPKAGHFH